MPREITTHQVNGCNESLRIFVNDEPGAGGANHEYVIVCDGTKCQGAKADTAFSVPLFFQNGPVPEVGTNGVTHEALLAVLIDRLTGFQAGKFACQENADALAHLKAAQATLHARTLNRVERGVEGTHAV
jgi:hypothetical protein